MGRSSAEQAQQNRARIVAEASRLFRERGVEAVSVADIMAAAGMTVGGFYKHFASKEALVREACALSFEQVARVWQKLVGERPDAAVIVEHYFRERPAHQTCPMLAFAPHVSGTDLVNPAREAYSKGVEVLLSGFLSQTGTSEHPEIPEEAQILFAAMIGAQLLAQASDNADWATALRQAVRRRARKQAHADERTSA
ncbi:MULTISPECIES: TetR/AcrR family transcriptional regulator [unclassified Paracoccus (in: a-proteobacteria)]|uniref:TetR/AcrR family transcriptional regulator n=1 Tax=unclassified Paracoccus (in: a-proteobacteria) TaxID=2688777 RepID=UPI00160238DE|nr:MULTISPECIES: TetR family transcriptional regulator [unclassified Paracoccus (in: a-proteobacteria)]MBB1492520.1 TetR family transcriptional regulator [Paracoccus sp. MC1854]MBB1499398.1 TetR family transcriptional regulator [Paracoccus sp. MC1862]QQO43964.1 TetR family transcriptional regulator [Paracoccus sp. MC1862]